jgi:hypothetical protein
MVTETAKQQMKETGHELPLCYLKVGVWRAVSVQRITGPMPLFKRN